MTLSSVLRAGTSIDLLAARLDALDHAGRVAQTQTLSASDQACLFALAQGRATTLARDFVPMTVAPLHEIIHDGQNSLPLFRRFQKRFARPAKASSILVGYNEQAMRAVTGPGYFVAKEEAHESGVVTVVIDYVDTPDEKASHWPEIRPNSERLSRFVYFGTRDWMWRVSEHVTIGRARRGASWMDNWFVLCRRPS